MKADEFLKQVQSRAHLSSRDQAMEATRATLAVLGQRLFGGEAKDLSAQLPREIGSWLSEEEGSESFGMNEFFRRVSEREGTDIAAASEHAKAVISVICDTVTPGEIMDVQSQLPKDFATLFESPTRH